MHWMSVNGPTGHHTIKTLPNLGDILGVLRVFQSLISSGDL